MPWIYNQTTGQLSYNGIVIATGYSGIGAGRNNPEMQAIRFVGPIPQGRYSIGPIHHSRRTGPYAMNLTPINHRAFGRDSFEIHGDNPTHTASSGCIILPRDVRQRIAASIDHTLEVVR